jgi:hypothetical protein
MTQISPVERSREAKSGADGPRPPPDASFLPIPATVRGLPADAGVRCLSLTRGIYRRDGERDRTGQDESDAAEMPRGRRGTFTEPTCASGSGRALDLPIFSRVSAVPMESRLLPDSEIGHCRRSAHGA